MVINMVISHHIKTLTTKMVNTTTIKHFIKIINIQINNIVDIQDLMVGKIKDIDRILWMIFLNNIKEIVHNMDLSKICIKIIKKILDNILSSLKEDNKKFVKHIKLNKWENKNNGEIINKNKWKIFKIKSYKKLVVLKKVLLKMYKVLLKLVTFLKIHWKVL